MRNASGLKLIISSPNNTSARGEPRESAKVAKISLDKVGLRDAIPNSNVPSGIPHEVTDGGASAGYDFARHQIHRASARLNSTTSALFSPRESRRRRPSGDQAKFLITTGPEASIKRNPGRRSIG
jgi:hypothetical protein